MDHFFHIQWFGNAHTQSGAMIYTSGIHVLLSKWFKNLLQIFSADADSRIRDRPSADQLMIMGRESINLRMNRPILSVVFDTVIVNIHHGAAEVQRTAVYKGMFVYPQCYRAGRARGIKPHKCLIAFHSWLEIGVQLSGSVVIA